MIQTIKITKPTEAFVDYGIGEIQSRILVDDTYDATDLQVTKESIYFELWDEDGKIAEYNIDIKWINNIKFAPEYVAELREKQINSIIK